jgi:hypothetical protein
MAATAPPRHADTDTQDNASSSDILNPVVLDLGKRRRKQVKQLRRGEGKLLDDVNGAVEELRTAGTLQAGAQPVIVIVREKKKKSKALKQLFPLL